VSTHPVPRKRRRNTRTEGPDPVNLHVGVRVKLRRTLIGLSQSQLGAVIGLTFQQIQKYETGFSRIPASALYRIAHALDVPVSFFFDDIDDGSKLPPASLNDLVHRESLGLVRTYYAIPEDIRQQVYELMKAMAREAAE